MRTRIAIALFVAAVTSAAFARPAEACSCLPPDLVRTYNASTDVVRAGVVFGWTLGDQQLYLARVSEVFKGCFRRGDIIVVVTPRSSAACGLRLDWGRSYLLTGDTWDSDSVPLLHVTICGYNVLWARLGQEDLGFLYSRYVCCGDRCRCADGSAPVQCLVDPCEVAPPCPFGECQANYCGGCHAELYDDLGEAVCTRCETDADCPDDQYCSLNGVCYPDGGCVLDYDCALEGNAYIRPACVGFGECRADQCAWECGDPRCQDLAGLDFGDCAMVLGWAVVDDACVLVGGCDPHGHRFFRTRTECVRTCLGPTAATDVDAARP